MNGTVRVVVYVSPSGNRWGGSQNKKIEDGATNCTNAKEVQARQRS